MVVTHDLGVAAQIADRIAVCYAGASSSRAENRRGAGPAHGIPTRPLCCGHETRSTQKHLPAADPAGEPPDRRNTSTGCPFAPRCAFPRAGLRRGSTPRSPRIGDRQLSHASARRNEIGVAHDNLRGRHRDPTLPIDRGRSRSWENALRPEGIGKTFKIRAGVEKGMRFMPSAASTSNSERGECVAIVGESGCGKSTLLRVVAGLVPAGRGGVHLTVAGRPRWCSRMPERHSRHGSPSTTRSVSARGGRSPRRRVGARVVQALER